MDWTFLRTDGRMRRTTFGVWCLLLTFVAPVLYVVPSFVFGDASDVGNTIALVILLTNVYVSWCVAVQRAHDMGRSWTLVAVGWALMGAALILIPVGFVAIMTAARGMLVFVVSGMCAIGALVVGGMLAFGAPDEDDRWGPDPR